VYIYTHKVDTNGGYVTVSKILILKINANNFILVTILHTHTFVECIYVTNSMHYRDKPLRKLLIGVHYVIPCNMKHNNYHKWVHHKSTVAIVNSVISGSGWPDFARYCTGNQSRKVRGKRSSSRVLLNKLHQSYIYHPVEAVIPIRDVNCNYSPTAGSLYYVTIRTIGYHDTTTP